MRPSHHPDQSKECANIVLKGTDSQDEQLTTDGGSGGYVFGGNGGNIPSTGGSGGSKNIGGSVSIVTKPDFSVGNPIIGLLPPAQPSLVISEVPTTPEGSPTSGIDWPSIGTTPPPLQDVIPPGGSVASAPGEVSGVSVNKAEIEALPGFAWWHSDNTYFIKGADGSLTPHTIEADVIVPSEEDDVSLIDWIDPIVGGILPGGTPPFWEDPGSIVAPWLPGTPNPGTWFGPGIPTTPTPVPMPTPPGAPTMPAANACDDPMKGMVWKKVCGQYRWVKQKNRRRKKLATKSDLAGLASLKGILGNGKAFEVWIATHS